jgi:CBS domain-containing protein
MLEMIASPNISLEKIGAVIEEDPAMAAKVLRLVNSAAIGLQMNVTRASEAVTYLGLETTKAMILIAHTMTSFKIHRVFVIAERDGSLQGVITSTDILRQMDLRRGARKPKKTQRV